MKRDSKKKSARTTKERTWSLKRNVKPALKKETWRILKKGLKKSSSWNYKMRKLRRFWNVKTKRKWLFYFNGVYLFILFRRKVNITDKGKDPQRKRFYKTYHFFRENWVFLSVGLELGRDCVAVEFAWVERKYNWPRLAKWPVYMGHITIKTTEVAVKIFTLVEFYYTTLSKHMKEF